MRSPNLRVPTVIINSNKVGFSLVPFNGGAMEHATNIAYPISAANGGLGSEGLMSHELAHMWWGDNITCQTDGDMWINEGWASFSVYLFFEEVYGREAYKSAMLDDLVYMLRYGHHFEEGFRAVLWSAPMNTFMEIMCIKKELW